MGIDYIQIQERKPFALDVTWLQDWFNKITVEKEDVAATRVTEGAIDFAGLDLRCTEESNSTVARNLCADMQESFLPETTHLRKDVYQGEGDGRYFRNHEVVERFHAAEYIVFNLNIYQLTDLMAARDYSLNAGYVHEAMNTSYIHVNYTFSVQPDIYQLISEKKDSLPNIDGLVLLSETSLETENKVNFIL